LIKCAWDGKDLLPFYGCFAHDRIIQISICKGGGIKVEDYGH